jgi:TatD DNase family protein
MHLSDAHCHLQNPRLRDNLAEILAECRSLGIRRWMVNATREDDWEAVAEMARTIPGVHAAFGLHPWWQKERSPAWAERLEALLRTHPRATLGETGLDRWMEAPDLADQTAVLDVHLELATRLGRPLTLHCLKAWPELLAAVKRHPRRSHGILLHSYSGPEEQIPAWVRAGAFFSFSPGFLHPNKAARRAAFQSVPADRLLLETDAPDMPPPEPLMLRKLPSSEPSRGNHPANLRLCLAALATDRDLPEEKLALQIEENTSRLFDW